MAYRCDRCGKGIVITSQQRHKRGVAGERWKYRAPRSKKILKPNLQTFRGILDGKKGKWRLCTRCLKIVKRKQKQLKEKSKEKSTTKKAVAEIVVETAKKKSPAPKSA